MGSVFGADPAPPRLGLLARGFAVCRVALDRQRLDACRDKQIVVANAVGIDLAVASQHDHGDAACLYRLHDAPAVYEHDVTWPNYKEASAYLAKLRTEALAGRSRTSTEA